ncbi:MAG: protein of unknown function transrane [Firmicutes bacterium]|nr:protein of unknown function transrane [Bacillota bacterium]
MSSTLVYVMLVLMDLFFSGAFITGKLAVMEFPAFSLIFFRFIVALPFIFAVLYWKEPKHLIPEKADWPWLILLGVIGTFFYHGLFFICLKHTTAINSSLIGATNPMITALMAYLFCQERMGLTQVIGIALSFLGVVMVVTDGGTLFARGMQFNPGDVMMFLAVCCMAVYSLISRRVMQRHGLSPIMITAYTFLVCTVVSIPFVLWENPATYLNSVTLGGWLAVLYMALFASVGGYLFQMIGIQQIGAPRTAVFMNLVPVFAIVQSIVFLGEPFSLAKACSTLLIILGVYLTTRPANPRCEAENVDNKL